ncbi:MAG: hypothetical protein IID16_00865 [Candidatus Marinimicrobia bacterium]|nr:hypothetical protein [Candidatus Neomarinimicrobiota bacterium]
MTKNELFEKYHINESHSKWDSKIDNWMSVEIYRIMHDGNLPGDDTSTKYFTMFLDKTKDDEFMSKLMTRDDWGSLYLTAKRCIYSLSDKILIELN